MCLILLFNFLDDLVSIYSYFFLHTQDITLSCQKAPQIINTGENSLGQPEEICLPTKMHLIILTNILFGFQNDIIQLAI